MNSFARVVSGVAFAVLAGSIIYAFTAAGPAATEPPVMQPIQQNDLPDQPYNMWNLRLDSKLRGRLQAETTVLALGDDIHLALGDCSIWNFCRY
jgi:hypothetical protein